MIWTRPPLSQWVLYGGLLASKDKNGNYVHIVNTNNYVHIITNFVCLVVMLKLVIMTDDVHIISNYEPVVLLPIVYLHQKYIITII